LPTYTLWDHFAGKPPFNLAQNIPRMGQARD
jgi:hypothetical protein